MSRSDTMSGTPMAAFVMGGLIGMAAGLLFAPKSGRESREMIKQSARNNMAMMKEKARQKKEDFQQAGKHIKDAAADNIVELKEDIVENKEPLKAKHTAL